MLEETRSSESPESSDVIQRRLTGLLTLVEVTCDLAAEHRLDRILDSVTRGVCAALDCERASLYLYDADSGELQTRIVTELEISEIRSSIDTGITGWVARRRKVANVPDPRVDARWNSAIDRQTGFHTRNILAAPLISVHNDRLVGVLQLLNRNTGAFDEFDERLLQAFAVHAASAVERAQLLVEARRRQELQLAADMGRSIQIGFLPQTLPDIPGYEVAAWWQPAEEVSGDYYDLVNLPDGRIGLIVADVSGHGLGPSLIMASARAMLRVLVREWADPGEILSRLAETISPDLQSGRFITCLIAALDPCTHRLTHANAGHGPALHFQRDNGHFRTFTTTALPLGFVEDGTIESVPETDVHPGDIILLATDGAVELMNEEKELFGTERLKQLVRTNCDLPAQELLDTIRTAIEQFNPRSTPPDDVTLLILKRLQQSGRANSECGQTRRTTDNGYE